MLQARAVVRDLYSPKNLGSTPINAAEALSVLATKDDMRVKDVAEKLGVSHASASYGLSYLVENGFATKSSSLRDGIGASEIPDGRGSHRSHWYSISDAGVAELARLLGYAE